MADNISSAEAKTVVMLYAEEGDCVQWGLIRALGELKIQAATSLILGDLNNPFHTECAIEALGKIGSDKDFNPILEFVFKHPESATIALIPMVRACDETSDTLRRRPLRRENSAPCKDCRWI
jgi:hypothetical protein